MVRDEFDPRDDEELPPAPGEESEHSGDESESTEDTSGESPPPAL